MNSTLLKIWQYLKFFIREISLGKYYLSFYFKSNLYYTSVFGGLISLAIIIGVIAYTLIVIVGVFYHRVCTVDDNLTHIYDSQELREATLGDLKMFDNIMLNLPVVDKAACNDVEIEVWYESMDDGMIEVGTFIPNNTISASESQNHTICQLDLNDVGFTSKFQAFKEMSAFNKNYDYPIQHVLRSKNYHFQQVSYGYYQNQISQSGDQKLYDTIKLDGKYQQYNMFLSLIQYNENQSIWGKTIDSQSLLGEFKRLDWETDIFRQNQITVRFQFVPLAEVYLYSPTQMVEGLVAIGGFLGFIRLLSTIIFKMHEKLFERRLEQFIKDKGEQPIQQEDVSLPKTQREETEESQKQNNINYREVTTMNDDGEKFEIVSVQTNKPQKSLNQKDLYSYQHIIRMNSQLEEQNNQILRLLEKQIQMEAEKQQQQQMINEMQQQLLEMKSELKRQSHEFINQY